MYSELSCNICEENYDPTLRIPLILPCGHTFCSSCLSSLESNPGYLCPEDRTKISIPFTSLPKNYSLVRILSQETLSPKFCKIHKKTLDYFCNKDRIKICPDCVVFGKHKSHEVIPIEEFYSKLVSKIHSLTTTQNNIQNLHNSAIPANFKVKIEKVSETLKEKKEELKNQVIKGYEKLINRLLEAQIETLTLLSKYFSDIDEKFLSLCETFKVVEKESEDWIRKSKEFLRKVSHGVERMKIADFEQAEVDCEVLLNASKATILELKSLKDLNPDQSENLLSSLSVDFVKSLPKEFCQISVKGKIRFESEEVHNRNFNERVFNQALDVLKFKTSNEADFSGAGELGDTANRIAPYLLNNTYLTKLKLVKNAVSDGAAVEIFRALGQNSTLQSLNLSQNSLSCNSLDELIKTLGINKTLQHVYLLGNPKMTPEYKLKLSSLASKSRKIHI